MSKTHDSCSSVLQEENLDQFTNFAFFSDAFAGGLLAGIVQQESLETSVDMGHWLAYLGIQQLGSK